MLTKNDDGLYCLGMKWKREDIPYGFEDPGYDASLHVVNLPVKVHCEDTSPSGHVRMESLVAFAERIRSLTMSKLTGASLEHLKEINYVLLVNEYVIEIVGDGCPVMETMRVETSPEFPGAPLFPWTTEFHRESTGELYAKGVFGLNLCTIGEEMNYRGAEKKEYDAFFKEWRPWMKPNNRRFPDNTLRFFGVFPESGKPFIPTGRKTVQYKVRGADCDLYSVLFLARVCSFLESAHPRYDVTAVYVNIATSVRSGDELDIHVLHSANSAFFLCAIGHTVKVTAFFHYAEKRPMCREELKCASMPISVKRLLNFCRGGEKPVPCKDFDLSSI